jgi:hypothetical protein
VLDARRERGGSGIMPSDHIVLLGTGRRRSSRTGGSGFSNGATFNMPAETGEPLEEAYEAKEPSLYFISGPNIGGTLGLARRRIGL